MFHKHNMRSVGAGKRLIGAVAGGNPDDWWEADSYQPWAAGLLAHAPGISTVALPPTCK